MNVLVCERWSAKLRVYNTATHIYTITNDKWQGKHHTDRARQIKHTRCHQKADELNSAFQSWSVKGQWPTTSRSMTDSISVMKDQWPLVVVCLAWCSPIFCSIKYWAVLTAWVLPTRDSTHRPVAPSVRDICTSAPLKRWISASSVPSAPPSTVSTVNSLTSICWRCPSLSPLVAEIFCCVWFRAGPESRSVDIGGE